ncbi:ras GTPase-activating protein 4 [Manacus vitellinus]|uniref:ras GTPase-activating protein 4 n=1 Tax=Manacus vitellinus TaxID=328815 RepID=UPI00115C86B5|nr:ras GTPase-activating protein 4 [Manacus vitellinus]
MWAVGVTTGGSHGDAELNYPHSRPRHPGVRTMLPLLPLLPLLLLLLPAAHGAVSIRIVEGRNLPVKDITGSSDPYCIVKIDDEAIIRTATVWKTLSPFWGEEYEVQLQPNFHSISIYVMDEDALSRDDVIGKVCITRDMLVEHPKGYSGWMSLSEVDPDEEVQGEIHLRVEVLGSQGSRRLRCSVLEARDLARKDRNGASDPFVRLRYNGKTQESTVVKKSCYPRWNETFEFELAEPAGEKLCVEVWDWDLVGRNDFLGKVVFSVQGLEAAGQEEGWFRLRPDKSKPMENERRGSLGSLQLQVRLRDEMVLPSHCYQPLVQLLCQEVKSGRQDGQVHLVTLLDETTTAECRQEVAVNLVKLFLGQGLVKEFLDLLFELELAKPCEPNTLFRSNSLASKSMESFLKVTGMPYLHSVLGPTIARVFEEKKYVELDPGKVEIKDVGILAAEKVEEKSFGSSHVMQVVYTDTGGQQETAYLQCKCVNELNQWLSALRKVCGNNPRVLRSYHPGVFRGDKWSCCHQRDRTGLGCDRTRHGVTLQDWSDPLDPTVEAQRLFHHLQGLRGALREKYWELQEPEDAQNGPRREDAPLPEGLSRLFRVLGDLENCHHQAQPPKPPAPVLVQLQT